MISKDQRQEKVEKLMDAIKQNVLEEFPQVDEKFVGSILIRFHIQTGSISGEPEVTKRGKVVKFIAG